MRCRCRMAASLLYGQATMNAGRRSPAEDPATLPWIKSSLERLGEAVAAIRTDRVAGTRSSAVGG